MMRKRLFTAVVLSLLSGGVASAQNAPALLPAPTQQGGVDQPPPSGPPVPVLGTTPAEILQQPPKQPEQLPQPGAPLPPRQTVVEPLYGVPPPLIDTTPLGPANRGWASVDFLLWWVKSGPLQVPLVTSGSAGDPIPGALGQPNTSVLYGNNNLDFGTLAGGRVSVGLWLPQLPVLGFDGGFFGFGQGVTRFSAFSDPNGSQIIARPVTDAVSGAQTSYIDSYPGYLSGGVSIQSTTSLDSYEFNVDFSLLQGPHWEFDLIAGFRALDLVESITIRDSFAPLAAGFFTFQGMPADPPSVMSDYDRFHTSNHFYGGQLGARFMMSSGIFDVTWTTKVGLGATHETISVDGNSTLYTPGFPPYTVPGGILAQNTNIGSLSRNVFTVVPETGINIGIRLNSWAKVTVGYTAVYWSNVVRPGDQIDRTVNTSQVPTDPTFGTLTGPARPVVMPQSTDFWAQGLNFGLELRF
jgi:hypothetical protein